MRYWHQNNEISGILILDNFQPLLGSLVPRHTCYVLSYHYFGTFTHLQPQPEQSIVSAQHCYIEIEMSRALWGYLKPRVGIADRQSVNQQLLTNCVVISKDTT